MSAVSSAEVKTLWKDEYAKIFSYMEIRNYGSIKRVCKLFFELLEDKNYSKMACENSDGQSNLFRIFSKINPKVNLKLEQFRFEGYLPTYKNSDTSLLKKSDCSLFILDAGEKINCLGPADFSIPFVNRSGFREYRVTVGEYLILQHSFIHLPTGKETFFPNVLQDMVLAQRTRDSSFSRSGTIRVSDNQFIFFNQSPTSFSNKLSFALCEIKEGECHFKTLYVDVLELLTRSAENEKWVLTENNIYSFQNETEHKLFFLVTIMPLVSSKRRELDHDYYLCELDLKKEEKAFTLLSEIKGMTNHEDFCFWMTDTGNGYIKEYEIWEQFLENGKLLPEHKRTSCDHIEGDIAWRKGRDITPLKNLKSGKTICSKVKKQYLENLLFIEGHTMFCLGEKSEESTKIHAVFLPTQQVVHTFIIDRSLPRAIQAKCKWIFENGNLVKDTYFGERSPDSYVLSRLRIELIKDKDEKKLSEHATLKRM